MKRNHILIFLVCVSLLLVSCGGSSKKVVESPFVGGTNGAVAVFEPLSIQENGVDTIFDSDDFIIEVVIKNKGEEVIPKGKANLRLLGPPQSAFKNIPSWTLKNVEDIDKVTEFNLDGGEEVITFTPTQAAIYSPSVTGFQDITFNLEYTYDYKTHVIISDVCFKGDITDPKVCEVKENKNAAVSSAPITVTSVAQDTGGKGVILLKVDISNAGQGESTLVGEDFDKTGRFDQISYKIDEPEKWKCSSGGRENEARLIDGKAQIICKLKKSLNEDELYTKPVRLTLDYTYKELLLKQLRIKESAK
ncbi:hypothetical protein HQ489_02220 [Candidatus Woesearchaeota archaeon]|nr:hypothetical protein [Candidatus Woesearchaeota archaeon]